MAPWVQAEENLLVQLIHMCGRITPIRTQFSMANICDEAAGLLEWEFDRPLSVEDVYAKVMELRVKFRNFWNFIQKEGIVYDWRVNLVSVTARYMREQAHLETVEETAFREKGLRNYKQLKCIFWKKKAALLPGEPKENMVDPDFDIIRGDSDADN